MHKGTMWKQKIHTKKHPYVLLLLKQKGIGPTKIALTIDLSTQDLVERSAVNEASPASANR